MKLVLAIVNNDDSAKVTASLTGEGFIVTKLSTTGGFLMAGNTTLLIGAQENEVGKIKEIISEHSYTRVKNVPTDASLGRGLGAARGGAGGWRRLCQPSSRARLEQGNPAGSTRLGAHGFVLQDDPVVEAVRFLRDVDGGCRLPQDQGR